VSEYQRLPKAESNLADVDHKATGQGRPRPTCWVSIGRSDRFGDSLATFLRMRLRVFESGHILANAATGV
jgi:hypothetical protein